MQSLAPGSVIQVPEVPDGEVLEQEVPSVGVMERPKDCDVAGEELDDPPPPPEPIVSVALPTVTVPWAWTVKVFVWPDEMSHHDPDPLQSGPLAVSVPLPLVTLRVSDPLLRMMKVLLTAVETELEESVVDAADPVVMMSGAGATEMLAQRLGTPEFAGYA